MTAGRIGRGRQADARSHQSADREPGVHLLQAREAPNQQARADQQRDRQRHFAMVSAERRRRRPAPDVAPRESARSASCGS